jgi:hypothetical protein
VHWIDTWNQLVIYNPLTDPLEPPTHEYQAYIISNPSRLSVRATFSFEFIKLPTPPVDAFGNTALPPWFWFQTLHNWKPGVKDLVLCSVTAGSDIGLLGRGNENDPQERWRTWTIEDENRRPAVPYDMVKNEETIVVGMQLDFTATTKIEKPLYPDEDPAECESLPILWVLNTSGQLAGWTMMYIPGIKAGERPVSMQPTEWQDQYWLKEREMRVKEAEQVDPDEQSDRELWAKEWQTVFSEKGKYEPPISSENHTMAEPPQHIEPAQQPEQAEIPEESFKQSPQPAPTLPGETTQQQSEPVSTTVVAKTPQPTTFGGSQVSQPAFGQPSQLGATKPTAFGQTGQLGGPSPGQSGLYSTFGAGLNANRTGHVFGQSSGLGAFSSPTPGSGAGGFAKYTSSQQIGGSGFLAGQTAQSGSFLSGAKGGSFLQGGQSSSFLQGGQSGSFLSGNQANAFAKTGQDQGFAKFATPNRGFATPPQSTTTPASFSEGGFVAGEPGITPPSQFGLAPKPSLSERTQSLASPASRSQSYDLLDDESEGTESDESEETDTEGSESDDDHSVRVDGDALNFGSSDFDLNLGGAAEQPETPNEQPAMAFTKDSLRESQDKAIAAMSASTSSESPSTGDDEYVKVGASSPTSPRAEKVLDLKDETPVRQVRSKSPTIPQAAFNPVVEPTQPVVVEKAITPPNPVVVQSRTSRQEVPTQHITPPKASIPPTNERLSRSASPSIKNKPGSPQFVPLAGTTHISSKLSDSAVISSFNVS